MKKSFWYDIGLAVFFILLQVLMFRHLDIYGVQTNVVLIFLFWICTVRERLSALILAAASGLILDILMDTWGVHMFSKTLIILIFHGFLQRQVENRLQPGQVFLLIFLIALVYNLIFLPISAFAGIYSLELSFLKYWIGNSAYIAAIAAFFYLVKPE